MPVLFHFAGAAEQLTEALIVNSCDTDATAENLRMALEMARGDRMLCWCAMMYQIEQHDVHRWQRDILDALAAARQRSSLQARTAA